MIQSFEGNGLSAHVACNGYDGPIKLFVAGGQRTTVCERTS